ncbi:MAG: GtrA family protein [Chthoniobacterales bacterium]
MNRAIIEAFQFLTGNDLRTILRRIRARNVPPLIQFAAYSLCGGLATIVFVGLTVFLSYHAFPAMDGMIVAGAPISDELRARNLLINNCIAFAVANVVAYVTNILFVFQTGRHHPVMEFLYFTAGGTVGFLISQFAGPWLVHAYGLPTAVAIFTNILAAIFLNFAIRKFFVFKN